MSAVQSDHRHEATHHDQKPIIVTVDNLLASLATLEDGSSCLHGERVVLHQNLRWDQRPNRLDTTIIQGIDSCSRFEGKERE